MNRKEFKFKVLQAERQQTDRQTRKIINRIYKKYGLRQRTWGEIADISYSPAEFLKESEAADGR